MTANENLVTGKVSVQYITTHTNHGLSLADTKYLPLPQSIREEVGDKFARGILLERIMDGKHNLPIYPRQSHAFLCTLNRLEQQQKEMTTVGSNLKFQVLKTYDP